MDTVRLSSFTLQATHGCYDHEKVTPQTFIIDVECVVASLFGTTDMLDATINYENIREHVIETFKEPPHNLIETLAVKIAQKVMQHSSAHKVAVRIAKPDIWKDCVPSVEVVRSK